MVGRGYWWVPWLSGIPEANATSFMIVEEAKERFPLAGGRRGAFHYLWYVGSARKGESVLEVVDPNTARVLRPLSISLLANDNIGAFTVTQNLG